MVDSNPIAFKAVTIKSLKITVTPPPTSAETAKKQEARIIPLFFDFNSETKSLLLFQFISNRRKATKKQKRSKLQIIMFAVVIVFCMKYPKVSIISGRDN